MYFEVAMDTPGNRGYPVDITDLGLYAHEQYKKAPEQSRHLSYYGFDKDLPAFLANHKALNGSYKGRYFSPYIWLDFDAESLEQASQSVREYVPRLESELGMDLNEDLLIYYTGNRGFHIQMPNVFGLEAGPEIPFILKENVTSFLNHPSIDLMPMNPSGLIRMPLSAHPKTGLCKVPMGWDHFLWALKKPSRFVEDAGTVDQTHVDLISELDAHIDTPLASIAILETTRFRKLHNPGVTLFNPENVMTCMQKLLARGPQHGHRHQDALRIGSWLWRTGIPVEVALETTKSWLSLSLHHNEWKTFSRVIKDAYEKGYSYSCQDEVMASLCDPKCIFFTKKNPTMQLSNKESMVQSYSEYMIKVAAGSGFSMNDLYDTGPKDYLIVPGEVVMVTGDTGLGKTCLVQNWVSKLKKKTLWINLEMAESLVFRRFLQINAHKTKEEINGLFAKGQLGFFDNINLDWLEMLSLTPELSDIAKMIQERSIEVLVVDTTDGVEVAGAGSNETFALKKIMEELRRVAQQYQIIVICIHHITKMASMMKAVDLNSLTGSRSNVTKTDHVFALGAKDKSQPPRILKSLKERDCSPVNMHLSFDFNHFKMTEAKKYHSIDATDVEQDTTLTW